VNSTISCIVIKSDHLSKNKIPCTGEIVGVTAETDLFVVMHVDRARGVAQLMERSGKHRLFDVSFGRLRIFNHTLAQTIHRILELSEQTAKA
jgi:hypothetical protein